MGRYDNIKLYRGPSEGWTVPNNIYLRGLTFGVRYIKVWSNGSTANRGNHLCGLIVLDQNGNNISSGKTITAEPAGKTLSNPGGVSLVTMENSYAGIGPEDATRVAFVLDLGSEHQVGYIRVARYYPDGRTYFGTAIEVFNGSQTLKASLHDHTKDGLYAETETGFIFDKWFHTGANSLHKRNHDINLLTSSGWQRKSLNYTDKRVKCNRAGSMMTFDNGSWFLNFNTGTAAPGAFFRFYCRVMKDVTNSARSIYIFRTTTVNGVTRGNNITWEADGRVSYNQGSNSDGYGTKYYSSNAVNVAGQYVDLEITCYGASSNFQIRWNNVATYFTSSPQTATELHSYAHIGTHGIYFEGYIRACGYRSNWGTRDVTFNLNNFASGVNVARSQTVNGITLSTVATDIDDYQYL